MIAELFVGGFGIVTGFLTGGVASIIGARVFYKIRKKRQSSLEYAMQQLVLYDIHHNFQGDRTIHHFLPRGYEMTQEEIQSLNTMYEHTLSKHQRVLEQKHSAENFVEAFDAKRQQHMEYLTETIDG